MPCIINKQAETSKMRGNIWEGYCGKTLWINNKPFKSPDDALKSDKPICKKCRRLAGLPLKIKNDIAHLTTESFEQWHVLVSACKYSKKVYDNRHCRTRNILKPSGVDVLSYFTAEALEDAILTGSNQLFLSPSHADSDVICNSMITFANDFLGLQLTGHPIIYPTALNCVFYLLIIK